MLIEHRLAEAIASDGWGRFENTMIHTEGPHWVRLSCPVDSNDYEGLVSVAYRLSSYLFSEATNNDATRILLDVTYDPNSDGRNFCYVTATVVDWAS